MVPFSIDAENIITAPKPLTLDSAGRPQYCILTVEMLVLDVEGGMGCLWPSWCGNFSHTLKDLGPSVLNLNLLNSAKLPIKIKRSLCAGYPSRTVMQEQALSESKPGPGDAHSDVVKCA